MPFIGSVGLLDCLNRLTSDTSSILLHLQIRPCSVDGSSPDWVRYSLTMLPIIVRLLTRYSGAQIIFRSFLQPVFSRYFSESGSTAANLRAQADSAGKSHAS